MEKDFQLAYEKAKEARERAYAPYSKFLVGASLVFSDGKITTGCNVENASYGATVCAERIALFSAIASGKKEGLKALILVTEPAASPCGLCLQTFSEHCPSDFMFYLADTKKIQKKFSLQELLPHSFQKKDLPKVT